MSNYKDMSLQALSNGLQNCGMQLTGNATINMLIYKLRAPTTNMQNSFSNYTISKDIHQGIHHFSCVSIPTNKIPNDSTASRKQALQNMTENNFIYAKKSG